MTDFLDDVINDEELIYTSEYNASLSKLCNDGLNYYYGTNGYEKDLERAYNIFMELGEQDDQDACVQLGCMYYLGHHVDQDYSEAMKWWEKAGEHDEALYGLGMIHHSGSEEDGIPKDPTKAKFYWEKASELFNEAATAALYKFYRTTEQTIVKHESNETINNIKIEMNILKEQHNQEIKRLTEMVKSLTKVVYTMNDVVTKNRDKVNASREVTNRIEDQLAEIIELCKCRCQNTSGVAIEQSKSDEPSVSSASSSKGTPRSGKSQSNKGTPRKSPRVTKKKSNYQRRGKKNLKTYLTLMLKVKKRNSKLFGKKNKVSEREQLMEVFRAFDADGNGSISVEEFRKGMMTLGTHLSAKEVKSLMEEVDEDGNGEIDYAEFCDVLFSEENEQSSAKLPQIK